MSPPPIKRRPPEKAVDSRKAIRNILGLLKDYKIKLAITVICAVISTVFSVISHLLIGQATTIIFNGINSIIHHTGTIDFKSLISILILVVVLYIISSVFMYLQSYFLVEILTKISYNLREKMMEKINVEIFYQESLMMLILFKTE